VAEETQYVVLRGVDTDDGMAFLPVGTQSANTPGRAIEAYVGRIYNGQTGPVIPHAACPVRNWTAAKVDIVSEPRVRATIASGEDAISFGRTDPDATIEMATEELRTEELDPFGSEAEVSSADAAHAV
jgi:hypothetical protein